MTTYNNEPIVSDCTGCHYILRHRGADDEDVCNRHPYPRMKWLGGFPCEDATFNKKTDQDYTFDGKYDSRYRVNKPPSKNKI